MASIENLQLDIVRNDGAASALVTYRPVGSTVKIDDRSVFEPTLG